MAGLKKAVKAAIQGPENRNINIRGHEFNVKKADIDEFKVPLPDRSGEIENSLMRKLYKTIRKFQNETYMEDGKNHVIARGQISHKISYVPDDQVYYKIHIADKKIVKIKRTIDEGGWKKILRPVSKAILKYEGFPIPSNMVDDLIDKIADMNPGDEWKCACDMIITAIAVECTKKCPAP